jgi:small-conductance mechanosensitive channel/CRP-like cAMP-binding protein
MSTFNEYAFIFTTYFSVFLVVYFTNSFLGNSKNISARRRKVFLSFFLLLILICIYALQITLNFLSLSTEESQQTFFLVSQSLFWISSAFLIDSLCDFFLWHGIFKKNGKRLVPKILTVVFSIALYTIFISLMLHTVFQQSVVLLVSTSGVSAFVLMYSAKGVFAHVFSGLSFGVNGNIKLGDLIRVNGHCGWVIEMNWRSIVLETREFTRVTIPNKRLADSEFSNLEYETITCLEVNVSSDHPPGIVIPLMRKAAYDCEKIDKSFEPICELRDISAAKATYKLKYKRINCDYYLGMTAVYIACYNRFKKAGVKFAAESNQLTYREPYHPAIPQKDLQKEDFQGIIKHNEMLSRFNADEIDTLFYHAKLTTYRHPERIMIEGDIASTLFIVKEGGLKSSILSKDLSHEVQVKKYSKGEFFGIQGLLTGERRRVTVRPTDYAEIVEIDRKGFENIFETRPEFIDLLSNILAERLDLQEQSIVSDEEARLLASESKKSLVSKFREEIKNLFHQ